MRRTLALAVLVLTGCVAPPRVVNQPLSPTTPDFYDVATATVYLDPETIGEWEATSPGSGQWIRTHAIGHHYTAQLKLDYGPGLAGQEHGADCYAAVMLNRKPPTLWPTTGGYGTCTPTDQATMATALRSIGHPVPSTQTPSPPVPRTPGVPSP